jgi:shikimate dehydrogenase
MPIKKQPRPKQTNSKRFFYFIGVTTGSSSIMKVFPRWMEVLGLTDVQIRGIDHKLHDCREAYRKTITRIREDPQCVGGLVTTHKIDIAEAAGDLFGWTDKYARLTGEISCIAKNPESGALEGYAIDPVSAGLSLDALLGKGYFGRTGGEVFCLGAGGSGTAMALHFCGKQDAADRPSRMVLVNRSSGRLEKLEAMLESLETDIQFDLVANQDPAVNDSIMEKLPPGSLVVNATGMGKDRPGSPLTDSGMFPRNGVAWEINYRGELDFWHQAKAQEQERSLVVEDGWLYFLHGWTQHLSQVLHFNLNQDIFTRLAETAVPLRPILEHKPKA